MKYILSILLFIALLILTSCEPLGFEVTTVKGKWKSDKTNGEYLLLNLTREDVYTAQNILNDTILLKQQQGTWILKNDTLYFFSQNLENKGISRWKVEQLSMNYITLKKIKNGDILVCNRVYSNQNLDYYGRFNEVFNLKRGFWWFAWEIATWIFYIVMVIFLLYGIGSLTENIAKWIRKKIRNNK